MFTGLIEGKGRIDRLEDDASGLRLRVGAELLGTPRRGESLAVDGVCLTVAESGPGWFEAVLSQETLSCTTFGRRSPGDPVNLERPLRLGDRLGGHLVLAHVDGVGTILEMRQEGSAARVRVGFPPELSPLIVQKGSIALDGISLTVAARGATWFDAALIPETLAVTTLGLRSAGDRVHLEVDIFGRYVLESIRGRESREPAAVTRELLARHGFSVPEAIP